MTPTLCNLGVYRSARNVVGREFNGGKAARGATFTLTTPRIHLDFGKKKNRSV